MLHLEKIDMIASVFVYAEYVLLHVCKAILCLHFEMMVLLFGAHVIVHILHSTVPGIMVLLERVICCKFHRNQRGNRHTIHQIC